MTAPPSGRVKSVDQSEMVQRGVSGRGELQTGRGVEVVRRGRARKRRMGEMGRFGDINILLGLLVSVFGALRKMGCE